MLIFLWTHVCIGIRFFFSLICFSKNVRCVTKPDQFELSETAGRTKAISAITGHVVIILLMSGPRTKNPWDYRGLYLLTDQRQARSRGRVLYSSTPNTALYLVFEGWVIPYWMNILYFLAKSEWKSPNILSYCELFMARWELQAVMRSQLFIQQRKKKFFFNCPSINFFFFIHFFSKIIIFWHFGLDKGSYL